MKWTTDKPTKKGWYWWRDMRHGHRISLVVYIEFGERGCGLVSFAYAERYRELKDMTHGEWAGPIPETEE